MSPAIRQALPLIVLAVLVLVKIAQPGPVFGTGTQPEAFPAHVAVVATPAPNIYGSEPKLRVLQLMASMDEMWRRAFEAAGDDYTRPLVEARARPRTEGCGARIAGWAGVYCFGDKRIVVDIEDQSVHAAMVGGDQADDLLGYVLAHEVGHHVQALRGVARIGSQADVVRRELHAECLAGVWGRAAGRAVPPAWSYAADADHGSAAQQRLWLERGHSRGRPADCDALFD